MTKLLTILAAVLMISSPMIAGANELCGFPQFQKEYDSYCGKAINQSHKFRMDAGVKVACGEFIRTTDDCAYVPNDKYNQLLQMDRSLAAWYTSWSWSSVGDKEHGKIYLDIARQAARNAMKGPVSPSEGLRNMANGKSKPSQP